MSFTGSAMAVGISEHTGSVTSAAFLCTFKTRPWLCGLSEDCGEIVGISSGRFLETRFCLTVETTHVRHKGKWLVCAPECCNYVVLDNDAQHNFYNMPVTRCQGRGGRHAVQVTRGGATRTRATPPSSLGLTPVFLSRSPLVDDLDGDLQCFVKLFLHICVCITNKSAP